MNFHNRNASNNCLKEPRDYSRIECQNCKQKGHTKVRCTNPTVEDGEEANNAGNGGYVGGGDNTGYGDNAGYGDDSANAGFGGTADTGGGFGGVATSGDDNWGSGGGAGANSGW